MDVVLTLLQEKLGYLEKFYRLNEQELLNMEDGQFERLDDFYHAREVLLEMVGTVDRRLQDEQKDSASTDEVSADQRQQIMKALNAKDLLVEKILNQDLQILSIIEKAKSQMIKDLQQVKAGKKAIRSYRQPDHRRQVNEKA